MGAPPAAAVFGGHPLLQQPRAQAQQQLGLPLQAAGRAAFPAASSAGGAMGGGLSVVSAAPEFDEDGNLVRALGFLGLGFG